MDTLLSYLRTGTFNHNLSLHSVIFLCIDLCIFHLQLFRKYPRSAVFKAREQKRPTGSGELVLILKPPTVETHLTILWLCLIGCVCVCVSAWNSALRCEHSPVKMRVFFLLSFQVSSSTVSLSSCRLVPNHLKMNPHADTAVLVGRS